MVEQPKIILFVEDMFASIRSIWDEIIETHPDWYPAMRRTVKDAWDYLCQHQVSAVVIDVMLPNVEGVEARLEGLYLAAWIRGTKPTIAGPERAGLPGELKSVNRSIPLCLLTAREVEHIRDVGEELGLELIEGEKRGKAGTSSNVQANQLLCISKADAETDTIIKWIKRSV